MFCLLLMKAYMAEMSCSQLSLTESAMYVYTQDQFASYQQRINGPLCHHWSLASSLMKKSLPPCRVTWKSKAHFLEEPWVGLGTYVDHSWFMPTVLVYTNHKCLKWKIIQVRKWESLLCIQVVSGVHMFAFSDESFSKLQWPVAACFFIPNSPT